MNRAYRLFLAASLVWAATLAFLMLLPSDALPQSALLSYDKLAHIGVFAALCLLLRFTAHARNAAAENRIKQHLIALTICIVYSTLLEFLQYFVPGRWVDAYDLMANTLGGVIGLILFVTFTTIRLRLKD